MSAALYLLLIEITVQGKHASMGIRPAAVKHAGTLLGFTRAIFGDLHVKAIRTRPHACKGLA